MGRESTKPNDKGDPKSAVADDARQGCPARCAFAALEFLSTGGQDRAEYEEGDRFSYRCASCMRRDIVSVRVVWGRVGGRTADDEEARPETVCEPTEEVDDFSAK